MKYVVIRKRTDGITDYFRMFLYGVPIYTKDIKRASKFSEKDKKELSKLGYKFTKVK